MNHPDEVGFSDSRLKRIDSLLQGYVQREELAGFTAKLARHGKTIFEEKFGWMDREAGKPMQMDTLFMIASMTKPVTSVAAMLLYEEGYFHLNTPLSRFIPEYKNSEVFVRQTESGIELAPLDREITMRHLFTHTSGLSYGGNEDDPVDRFYQAEAKKFEAVTGKAPDLKDLMQHLPQMPLAFQPGTHWRYGLNIDVIGMVVEVISGMPLQEFMRKRIFEPLGMLDTAFFVPPEKVGRASVIYGHEKDKDGLQRLDIHFPVEEPDFVTGGSGLITTLHDYSRFTQMLVNGGDLDGVRLLSPHTMALYSMNHAPEAALPYGFAPKEDLYHAGYGFSLGTRVLMDVSKSGIYGSPGEFGWDGAFGTCFWVDPKEALYGILMLQHYPNAYYPVAQQFKQLTYQALVE